MERLIKWNLKEREFKGAKEILKDISLFESDEFVGSVEIGELCVDFVLREYDDSIDLDFDIYVGGIDTGYGFTKYGMPYDFADGGQIVDSDSIDKIGSFDDFKKDALKQITEFIKSSPYKINNITLDDKANSKEFFKWNSGVDRYTSEDLIKDFKELSNKHFGMVISPEDEEIINENLKEHKDCITNGEVVNVFYGDDNLTMECTACDAVVIDTDALSEEEVY